MGLHVPLGALDRLVRQLARREQTTQARIARDLLVRCRALTRSITELDRELQPRTATIAPKPLQLPGCGPLTAAKLLCEIDPIDRFRTDAQTARHPGVAPLDASSGKHQRHASTQAATDNPTAPSIASRSPKAASTSPRAPTSNANKPKARAAAKRSAASKRP
jgi:transposase